MLRALTIMSMRKARARRFHDLLAKLLVLDRGHRHLQLRDPVRLGQALFVSHFCARNTITTYKTDEHSYVYAQTT